MATTQLAVMGMFWGLLCGLGPLVYGLKRGRDGLALTALLLCAVSGAVSGVFLALPVALVMFAVMAGGK